MNRVTTGAWRFLRYSSLVLCAGGLLAADNTWISTVSPDLLNPTRWFWSASANDSAVLPAAVNAPIDMAPGARLEMDGLLHGLLFERPAGRWALNSRTAETQSSLARRLVEFDQINPASAGDNFAVYEMRASWAPIVAAPTTATFPSPSGPELPSAVTASGTWISNASGNWGTTSNWSGGIVADGAGNAANFNTVNLTTNVTVTLDTSRTIGSVFIGDTDATHRYTIASSGGSSLTFDSGAAFTPAQLQQTSTSAGDTFAANILLNSSLDIVNSSATNPFTISGNISSTAASGSLFVSTTGTVNVSGNISDGTAGGDVGLQVLSGVTTLTGTNTYSDFTSVSGNGTLLVNGNNSGATDFVFVNGTLGGTGTVGGIVQTFDGTITGGTTTTVGALTLTQDVNLATMEGSGTYLANLSGSTSDLLAITGELILGQGSILDIQGAADGVTTYTLATFASHDDVFATVMGLPGGYSLVYHDTDLQLVPIPEPATWIGGSLVLAALAFSQRRRLRRA